MMTTASDRLLTALVDRFESARDDERAVRMAAYMRDQFPFYGIPNPIRVALEREAVAETGASAMDEADLTDFAFASWARDEREHQYAAAKLLRRNAKVLSPAFLTTAQTLLTTKSWWDTVETMATILRPASPEAVTPPP